MIFKDATLGKTRGTCSSGVLSRKRESVCFEIVTAAKLSARLSTSEIQLIGSRSIDSLFMARRSDISQVEKKGEPST